MKSKLKTARTDNEFHLIIADLSGLSTIKSGSGDALSFIHLLSLEIC